MRTYPPQAHHQQSPRAKIKRLKLNITQSMFLAEIKKIDIFAEHTPAAGWESSIILHVGNAKTIREHPEFSLQKFTQIQELALQEMYGKNWRQIDSRFGTWLKFTTHSTRTPKLDIQVTDQRETFELSL